MFVHGPGQPNEDCVITVSRSGGMCKVITTYSNGPNDPNHLERIVVANPGISFMARRSSDPKQPIALDYLSSRRGLGYELTRGATTLEGHLLRAHYSYFEVPLTEYLTWPGMSIGEVAEESSGGKSLVRVRVQYVPPSAEFRKTGFDHQEGWFLFEPAAHWILRGLETKQWKQDGQLLQRIKATMDYDLDGAGIPLLRRARYDIYFKSEDRLFKQYQAEVRGIRFGAVGPAEFTLEGCGITGVTGPRRVPYVFYASLACAALSFIAIVLLRRGPRHTAAPAP
jgi:hypothetical protein